MNWRSNREGKEARKTGNMRLISTYINQIASVACSSVSVMNSIIN